jgi:hypothetical protein
MIYNSETDLKRELTDEDMIRIEKDKKYQRDLDRQGNLNKYYKYVLRCSRCNRVFGTDAETLNKLCPICEQGSQKSMLIR